MKNNVLNKEWIASNCNSEEISSPDNQCSMLSGDMPPDFPPRFAGVNDILHDPGHNAKKSIEIQQHRTHQNGQADKQTSGTKDGRQSDAGHPGGVSFRKANTLHSKFALSGGDQEFTTIVDGDSGGDGGESVGGDYAEALNFTSSILRKKGRTMIRAENANDYCNQFAGMALDYMFKYKTIDDRMMLLR